jgi:ribose transport system ATP-binding protein
VSHRLAEVFALCDEVTVIRDGRVILSRAVAATNMRELVEAIAGGAVQERSLEQASEAARSEDARPVLEVRALSVSGKLRDISFALRAGEILGVAGLAGSGRSTLLKSLFGIVPRSAGDLWIGGRRTTPNSPRRAIRCGFYLIPENRKAEGLVLSHSVVENLVLSILKRLRSGPLLSAKRSAQAAAQKIAQLHIRPADPRRPVEWLSGGNQQKVVLGKAFNVEGQVLLLDEPTFGVDVHSRAEIRSRVREFVNAGNGAVWVTSDLQELRNVADRILILADGGVKDIVPNRPQALSESEITHLIQHERRSPAAPSERNAGQPHA